MSLLSLRWFKRTTVTTKTTSKTNAAAASIFEKFLLASDQGRAV
jgi:hypothetical protein